MTTSTISISEQNLLLSNAQKAVSAYCKNAYSGFFSKEDMEDIVGNTMVKACKSLHKYNPNLGKLSTWVSTIAVNCTKDAARNKGNHLPISHSMIELDEDGGECNVVEIYGSCGRDYEADRNVDFVDFESSVKSVTDTIKGVNRKYFDMMVSGYSPRQMAQATGCTSNAVSVRKNKILGGIKEPIRTIALEFDVHNNNLAC